MAITEIKILKNWFKNLAKPTQEQFWAWMDSFWHKSEKIPQSSIENWDEFLNTLPTTGTLRNYLLKDGDNIDEESRTALREKLGVGDVPANVGLLDTEDAEGNVYDKEQTYSKNEIDETYKGISVDGERIKYENDAGQTYDVLTTEFNRFKTFLENLTDTEKQQIFNALGSLRVIKLGEEDAVPTNQNAVFVKQIP